jgi:predicted esterase
MAPDGPFLVWLHGLGDSGQGWAHLQRELNLPQVRYAFPTAPTNPVTCNGGYEMTSWMDLDDIPVTTSLPDDVAGLDASTKIVHAIIEREVANGTPSTSIVLGGFSQGAAMALLAGFSFPKPLGGIVAFSGWAAKKAEYNTIVAGGANAATPAFVGHGSFDEVVEPACGSEAAKLLEQHGNPNVTFNTYPMAHGAPCAEPTVRAASCVTLCHVD